MQLRFCRYCENTESNMSLMYQYYNKKGKLIIDNIHFICSTKELEKTKEKERFDVKIRKCKYCDISESKDVIINKFSVCSKCKYVKILENKKKYNLKAKEETRIRKLDREPLYRNRTIIDNIPNIPEQKKCNCCSEVKHISYFYKNKQFQYYGTCKECHNKKTSTWRINNIEKVKAYQKEYLKSYKRKRS